MSRRHSTRNNGWYTRRRSKEDIPNEDDEVNFEEAPVRWNNPFSRDRHPPSPSNRQPAFCHRPMEEGSTRSSQFQEEDDLPGAYAVSRRSFRRAGTGWDPTEQEVSFPTPSLNPTNDWQSSPPYPRETLDETTIIDAHVVVTDSNDIATAILESTQNESSLSQSLKMQQSEWKAWYLFVGIGVLITIVVVVFVLIFLSKKESISQPVEENFDTCNSADTQDPFYQCRCYHRIEITDDEVRKIYMTQLDTTFLYYEHNETTISVTGDITSCDPDNIALVWLAIDSLQAQETNEAISLSSEMLIPRWTLCRFYATLGGAWWHVQEHWLQHNVSICHWYGVLCDSETGKVTSLSLPNNNITGNLGRKPILSILSDLRILNLTANGLTGSLPMDLMSHKNLEKLILDKNALTGTMERNGAISRSLYELSLSGNKLSGSLPWLTGMTNLKRLMLSENNFHGTIPDSWRNLTTLTALDLGNQRDLSGSISNFLPSWTSLSYLSLRATHLSGNLSEIVSQLSSLEYLDLYFLQLRGTITTFIGGMQNLSTLDLGFNSLTGTIPTEIGNCRSLKMLLLSSNQLSGTLPMEMEELRYLHALHVDENINLFGTISESFKSLDILQEWDIYQTQITCPSNAICKHPEGYVYVGSVCSPCVCCRVKFT